MRELWHLTTRPATLIVIALLAVLASASVARAHVTVWPQESTMDANELYTIRVPTERDNPTVRVRVEFPDDIVVSRFVPAPGWQKEVERGATGRISAVTWSGGSIAPDELGLFQFSARNPAGRDEISFKAYQHYSDGSVVEWTGPRGASNPAAAVRLSSPAMSAAQLSQASNLSHVITAVWILDNSGLHALEDAVAGGQIPVGSLGPVQRARAIAAATMWPEGLREDAHKLVNELSALQAAIAANDAAAAAHPAHEVHEMGHDLAARAYEWLGHTAGHESGADHH